MYPCDIRKLAAFARENTSLAATGAEETFPGLGDGFQAALDRLSPRQRAALLLRELEDQPFAEIAAALGCGEATARVHYHRACRNMRQWLENGDDLVFSGNAQGAGIMKRFLKHDRYELGDRERESLWHGIRRELKPGASGRPCSGCPLSGPPWSRWPPWPPLAVLGVWWIDSNQTDKIQASHPGLLAEGAGRGDSSGRDPH